MEKTNIEKPNIFNYATKELSQDAMICWFLECLNSTNKKYQEFGLNFVKFIFDDKNDKIKSAKLFNDASPKTQYNKIDVYAEIIINEKTVHSVIFEDKTNTYLHDDQMYKYINNIYDETNTEKYKKHLEENNCELGNILYVYFKTGFASNWEKEDIKQKQESIKNKPKIENVKFKEIYLDKINTFLNGKESIDNLLDDYIFYLRNLATIREEYINSFMKSSAECNEALDKENQAVSTLLLENIFGKGCWVEYTAKNKLAIVYPFYTQSPKHKNDDKYRIFYNLGIKGSNSNYYLRLTQWRDEDKCKDDLDFKLSNAEELKKICKEIYNKIGKENIKLTIKNNVKSANSSFDSQEIFRITLKEHKDIKLDDIFTFLNSFMEELNKKVEKKLNATLLDYKVEKDWNVKNKNK